MKSKKSNYLLSTVILLAAVAIFLLFSFLLNKLNTPTYAPSKESPIIYIKIFYNILRCLPAVLIFIHFPYFEKITFNEHGVSFYRYFRRLGFFGWNEIESISVIYGEPFVYKMQEFSVPYVIAITEDHRTIPKIDKRGRVTSRDENGKKLKFNRNTSKLAWIFGIGASCSDIFIEHIKRYRPEFIRQKKKNLSCIGYD